MEPEEEEVRPASEVRLQSEDPWRLSIRSIAGWGVYIDKSAHQRLDLTAYFRERCIRDPAQWREGILPQMRKFLSQNVAGWIALLIEDREATMSALPTYFKDFLGKIRLTSDQVTELKTEHTKLRERLEKDEKLSKILVATFLQGSYRRATIVRPKENEHADVDIIVVTTLDRFQFTPQDALEPFRPFMVEHYKHQYHLQGRSIGIQLEHVDLDVVVTSAPPEADQQALRSEAITTLETLEEADDLRFNAFWISKSRRDELGAFQRMQAAAGEPEWKGEPLWIPDRDLEEWVQTHPLEQMRWTRDKNMSTGTHFVNIVKAIKWWVVSF